MCQQAAETNKSNNTPVVPKLAAVRDKLLVIYGMATTFTMIDINGKSTEELQQELLAAKSTGLRMKSKISDLIAFLPRLIVP